MTEERQLGVAHRLLFRPRQRSGHREPDALGEVVEPAPAVEGEKLMVRRRANLAPQPRPQLEHGLAPGGERVRRLARLQSPGLAVDGEYAKAALPLELPDRPIRPLVR